MSSRSHSGLCQVQTGEGLAFVGLTYLWGNTEPGEWALGTGRQVCIIPTSHIYHVARGGLLWPHRKGSL